MLEPAAIAVIGLLTPASRMGRVMGSVSLVINIGPVVGPLLGAALAGAGAWAWIFWINVPLAVIVGIAAWLLVPAAERSGDPSIRVDVLGLMLLPPGFVLILLGVNRWGAGADVVIAIALAVTGLVLLALYVRHALRADSPLLDVRLLKVPSFAAALGVMSAVGLIMYTQLTVLPVIAVRGRAIDPLWQASPVAVLGLGLLVSMTVAGSLSDTVGPRALVRGGAALTSLTAVLIAIGHDRWPLAVVLVLIALLGLGFGAIASPTFASLYRVLPKASVGEGTAALFIVVQLFASAGVTVVGLLTEAVADPGAAAYALVAAVAAAVLITASWMPGRPDA